MTYKDKVTMPFYVGNPLISLQWFITTKKWYANTRITENNTIAIVPFPLLVSEGIGSHQPYYDKSDW